MKKRITEFLIIAFFLFLLVPEFSSEAKSIDYLTYQVHVTDTGKKYHKANCYHLRSDNIANIIDAVEDRKTPCADCQPPVLTKEQADKILQNCYDLGYKKGSIATNSEYAKENYDEGVTAQNNLKSKEDEDSENANSSIDDTSRNLISVSNYYAADYWYFTIPEFIVILALTITVSSVCTVKICILYHQKHT